MRRKDSGVALLMVMGIVAVLAVIAVELASRATVDALASSRSLREAGFRRLADSGVVVAKGLLQEPEAKAHDYWGERWNERATFTLSPHETGVVQISDESGKINIGIASAAAGDDESLLRSLRRLFEYLSSLDPGRAIELRDAEGKVLSRLGFSATPGDRHPRKPDPLITLDGLRESGLSVEQIFGKGGFSQYLTCFGDGKINLNTAPSAVLYALDDELDHDLVKRIAAYRGNSGGQAGRFRPFEDPKDLELVDGIVTRATFGGKGKVLRNLYSKIQDRVTTRSACFSIRVECHVGDRLREAWTYVEPGREEKAGQTARRTLRHLVYEEILP